MTELTAPQQRRMVDRLFARLQGQQPNSRREETHISHVILTGDRAYKIKKPVDLGFLDFSTLKRRHRFCREEIRLNKRLAPALYRDVVPITGTLDKPELNGGGAVLDYAVAMVRFDSDRQLDRLLQREPLPLALMDDIGGRIADFHGQAPASAQWGDAEAVWQPAAENFEHLTRHLEDAAIGRRLERLRQWSRQRFEHLRPCFEQRRQAGFVRECHGDMHLRNIALLDGEVVIFDGIEFSEQLRWIDVMSELAFLYTDLLRHDLRQHANRLLNVYLERTGDYDGLAVFDFYALYRAMVRAKVTAIRRRDTGLKADEAKALDRELAGTLELAERLMEPRSPAVVITVGVSGSGKSTVAQWLGDDLGLIRVRTDVERRRLYPDRGGDERYDPEAIEAVYRRLESLAVTVTEADYGIVLDGTYLAQNRRDRVRRMAADRDVPFAIVDLQCSRGELVRRIRQRAETGADPSEADLAVLDRQLATGDPLGDDERDSRVNGHCADPIHRAEVVSELAKQLGWNLIGESRTTLKGGDTGTETPTRSGAD